MYQRERLRSLYPKLIERTISDHDLAWLLVFFKADRLGECYAAIRIVLDDAHPDNYLPPLPHEAARGIKLYHAISKQIGKEKVAVSQIFTWRSIIRAAVLVLLGAYTFNILELRRNIGGDTLKQDAATGCNRTLLPTTGEKNKLTGIQRIESPSQNGLVISRLKDPRSVYCVKYVPVNINPINNLSKPKAETPWMDLSDGTRAWLNAASELTYTPSLHQSDCCNVNPESKGYFEVAKCKAHPFVALCREVKVLAPHFKSCDYVKGNKRITPFAKGSVIEKNGPEPCRKFKMYLGYYLDFVGVKKVTCNQFQGSLITMHQ